MFNIAQEKFAVLAGNPLLRPFRFIYACALCRSWINCAPDTNRNTTPSGRAFYALFAQAFITSVRLLCEREVPLTHRLPAICLLEMHREKSSLSLSLRDATFFASDVRIGSNATPSSQHNGRPCPFSSDTDQVVLQRHMTQCAKDGSGAWLVTRPAALLKVGRIRPLPLQTTVSRYLPKRSFAISTSS